MSTVSPKAKKDSGADDWLDEMYYQDKKLQSGDQAC